MKSALVFLCVLLAAAAIHVYLTEPSCIDPPKTVIISSQRPSCAVWAEIQVAHAKANSLMAEYDKIMGLPYEPQPLGDQPIAFFEQKDVFVIEGESLVGIFKPNEVTKASTIMWAEPLETEYRALAHEVGHYVWWRRYGAYPYGENLWGYAGHGVPWDPYILALNSLIDRFIDIGSPAHPYHPGYLPAKAPHESYFSRGTCYMPFIGTREVVNQDGF